MTLTQLRYLIAIADSGLSITLAAERVHATQPGISKQLKQLEDELGFLLFSRKGRSLEAITPAGEQVLAHARRAVAEAANLRALAANQRGETQGALTLVTTHTQARYVLPSAVAAVMRAFPQVSVHMQPAAEREVLARLASGHADLARICRVRRAKEVDIETTLECPLGLYSCDQLFGALRSVRFRGDVVGAGNGQPQFGAA